MLKEIEIAGFKTLAQPTKIKLEPVSVLVGANNSGKTNVLAAIDLVGEIARAGPLDRAIGRFGGGRAFSPRLGGAPFSLNILGESDGALFTYEVRVEPGRSGDNRIGQAKLTWHTNPPRDARSALSFLQGIQTFDFSVPALRTPATIVEGAKLGRDGSGLAAVLDELAGRAPKIRDEIDAEVRKAAREVSRVVTLPADKGMKVVGVEERSGQIFSADEMSDGLLIFIALSTVIQMSGGRTLIGIEELEKGVHPRRISEIVDQLVRISANGSQFVLTTHSPVLLNEFRDYPERVLICDRDGEQTRVTPLSEHPDWQETVSGAPLGDIWYSGVLGGVPK